MQSESRSSAHRGAPENPPNRFEPIRLERDRDWNPGEDILPRTPFTAINSLLEPAESC
jgi:hypothetical protein